MKGSAAVSGRRWNRLDPEQWYDPGLIIGSYTVHQKYIFIKWCLKNWQSKIRIKVSTYVRTNNLPIALFSEILFVCLISLCFLYCVQQLEGRLLFTSSFLRPFSPFSPFSCLLAPSSSFSQLTFSSLSTWPETFEYLNLDHQYQLEKNEDAIIEMNKNAVLWAEAWLACSCSSLRRASFLSRLRKIIALNSW